MAIRRRRRPETRVRVRRSGRRGWRVARAPLRLARAAAARADAPMRAPSRCSPPPFAAGNLATAAAVAAAGVPAALAAHLRVVWSPPGAAATTAYRGQLFLTFIFTIK